MLIHNRIENSAANGPGNRAVIWTQGCRGMNCPGCWNLDTHDFDLTTETTVFGLVDWVLGIPGIEGVTFSGGEPFQQGGELHSFCKSVKERQPDFSVGAYTGYTLLQLRRGQWTRYLNSNTGRWVQGSPWLAREILDTMDFLVAGRYVEALKCEGRPLCGSGNQQVHFLTDRYSQANLTSNIVEMFIDAEANRIQVTGFPSDADSLTAA